MLYFAISNYNISYYNYKHKLKKLSTAHNNLLPKYTFSK